MCQNATSELEPDAKDESIGPINPHNPPEGFSSHVEPHNQGGKRYWRCKSCGVESISWCEDMLTSANVHRDRCSNPWVDER